MTQTLHALSMTRQQQKETNRLSLLVALDSGMPGFWNAWILECPDSGVPVLFCASEMRQTGT
jgi:hypothetical protein